jgi:ABC-type lipoprotein release transport system permease subunit
MGVFFEKRKSTKSFIIIRILMITISGVIVVTSIINGFDFWFLRLVLLLGGITSVIDGVENYLKRENKWRYYQILGLDFCGL